MVDPAIECKPHCCSALEAKVINSSPLRKLDVLTIFLYQSFEKFQERCIFLTQLKIVLCSCMGNDILKKTNLNYTLRRYYIHLLLFLFVLYLFPIKYQQMVDRICNGQVAAYICPTMVVAKQ